MQIRTPACSPSQPKALECSSVASWSLCTFRNKDVFHRYLWIDNVFSIEHSETIVCISIMAHKVRTAVTITGASRHRQSEEKSAWHPERQQLPKIAEHVLLLLFVWWSSVPACINARVFSDHTHTHLLCTQIHFCTLNGLLALGCFSILVCFAVFWVVICVLVPDCILMKSFSCIFSPISGTRRYLLQRWAVVFDCNGFHRCSFHWVQTSFVAV